MPLVLLRHTRVDYDPEICYGDQEVPLAESFEEEVGRILTELKRPDRVLSSPVNRCYALARRIGDHFGIEVQTEPRLRELHQGRWQGKRWSQISPREVDLWVRDFLNARPHGGETVSELCERLASLLAEIGEGRGKRILLVTHKGVMRAFMALSGEPDPWSFNPGYGEKLML